MADFTGAEPSGVVFGRSATQLTFDFARTLARDWRPGDEVFVTRLDHDANIRPWVMVAQRSAPRSGGPTSIPRPRSWTRTAGRAAVASDPAGRGHRSQQPAGHQPRPPAARRTGSRRRGPAVDRRRPPRRPRSPRCRRPGCRLPRVLAVQVPRTPSGGSGGDARPAGDLATRQAAAVLRRRARAVRARDAAVRAAGRDHRGRGLSGRARRPRRVEGRRSPGPTRRCTNEDDLRRPSKAVWASWGAGLQPGRAAYLDRALRPAGSYVGRGGQPTWLPTGSTPRPAASTPSRPHGTSVWGTTAPSGSGLRRTATSRRRGPAALQPAAVDRGSTRRPATAAAQRSRRPRPRRPRSPHRGRRRRFHRVGRPGSMPRLPVRSRCSTALASLVSAVVDDDVDRGEHDEGGDQVPGRWPGSDRARSSSR